MRKDKKIVILRLAEKAEKRVMRKDKKIVILRLAEGSYMRFFAIAQNDNDERFFAIAQNDMALSRRMT